MKYLQFLSLFSILFSQNNTSFNPNIHIAPEPQWPQFINPLLDYGSMVNIDKSLDSNLAEIEGFRVQVFATQDRNKADELQEQLTLKFNEKNYIIFEAPNYKLRIGDFLDRDEAEKLRMKLVVNNFPSSWIVRTRILPDLVE